jgi:hypothetical protein
MAPLILRRWVPPWINAADADRSWIVIAYRFVRSPGLAAPVGGVGLRVWPFPADHPLLGLIAVNRPALYAAFLFAYATVGFITPSLVINIVSSFAYIFVAPADQAVRPSPLPPYPRPEHRDDLSLILGEQHRRASVAPAAEPRWLTIPEPGLYTGLAIVGAIGTGKTSACMYPYVEQQVGGTTLTIRRFQSRFLTADELVRSRTLTEAVLDQIRAAIDARQNVLISAFLPVTDIEETAELQIDKPNVVPFEAGRAQNYVPAVRIRDLLKATLRHRPDRVIVGEVRGGEAYDLLQALNTGHAGSLSTIPANAASQALARLASCVLQAGVELPYVAIRQQFGDAIAFVLHLERRQGVRRASELLRVWRYVADGDHNQTDELTALATG